MSLLLKKPPFFAVLFRLALLLRVWGILLNVGNFIYSIIKIEFILFLFYNKIKTIKMLPALPCEWVYGEKVPFPESNNVEFKEVSVYAGLFRDPILGKTGLTKYRETIHGFLNGGSGYLLMGVKDDGTIVGVENLAEDGADMLRLWIDSSFNTLVYKDGKTLDPSKASITFSMYPVLGCTNKVIVIKVINSGKPFNIMTLSGVMVHRLNASNFKVTSEPVYRKRDVKGMIYSMQGQIDKLLAEKKRYIYDLKEKHKEEIQRVLQEERASIRDYIEKISCSLYEKYRLDGIVTFDIVSSIKYLLCMK